MTNELSELGKAAVAYAEAGIAIIPLKPRGKKPYIKGGSTKATANVEQVRKHWMTHPDDNIAIVCGGVSDGLFAIDVDCHGDVDGWDTLAEFEADRPLPAAPTSITGSGGGHMLYRSAEAVRNGVGSDTGIDVRGEGGYIVAPPSIHPNGNAYRWETSPLDMDIPEADANVLALVESIRPVDSDTAKLTMPDVIHEGEGRDNALYKLACSQRANNLPYETALVTVMDYNQRCCVPPMSERVVRQKVDSAYRHAPGHSEKVRMAEKAGDENKPKRGRPRKFDHAKVAERLVTERGACLIDGMTPAVRDSDGRYVLGWDAFDGAIIEMAPGCTSTNRKEAKLYVQATAPRRSQSPWNLMAFANGVLDVLTLDFREFGEDDLIANVIPHAWNPDAKSAVVDATFAKMAAGDPAAQMNLIEIIGICMARSSVRFPYCPVLIGTGSNGKSTYMRMLKQVLGDGNISALQPRELSARFMASHMVGKLANLGDDIANGYLDGGECAAIKRVATGDTMFTDVKGGSGYKFEPYATMVFACNEFPRVADTSDGFLRRLFAVEFAATFSRDDADYDMDIGDKLATEQAMEYACKLGIEGLRHVIANGGLTENRANERVKGDIAESSNSALQWVNDDGITAEDIVGKTKDEAYALYEKWCRDNGYSRTALSAKTVADFLKRRWHLSITRNGHRGTGVNRKTVKEFERRGAKK